MPTEEANCVLALSKMAPMPWATGMAPAVAPNAMKLIKRTYSTRSAPSSSASSFRLAIILGCQFFIVHPSPRLFRCGVCARQYPLRPRWYEAPPLQPVTTSLRGFLASVYSTYVENIVTFLKDMNRKPPGSGYFGMPAQRGDCAPSTCFCQWNGRTTPRGCCRIK